MSVSWQPSPRQSYGEGEHRQLDAARGQRLGFVRATQLVGTMISVQRTVEEPAPGRDQPSTGTTAYPRSALRCRRWTRSAGIGDVR
jgi:hypothetical protein